jgi:hypothetical protein
MENSETLILKKKFEGYSRIYFLSNNSDQLIELFKTLSEDDIINIPSKIDINSNLQKILTDSNYSLYETYTRLYNNNLPKSFNKFIDNFATIDDIPLIYDILYSNFVPFTDHLPSKEELVEMINNRQIFVNRNDSNEVTGVLGVEYKTARCYLSLFIDKTESYNGLFLLFNFFSYMRSLNINRSYIWTNCNNIKTIKLYQFLGYKEDGLKDYTYTKRPLKNNSKG